MPRQSIGLRKAHLRNMRRAKQYVAPAIVWHPGFALELRELIEKYDLEAQVGVGTRFPEIIIAVQSAIQAMKQKEFERAERDK